MPNIVSCVGTYITQAKQFVAATGGLAGGTFLVSKMNLSGLPSILTLVGSILAGFLIGRTIFTDMTGTPAHTVADPVVIEVAGYFNVSPNKVTDEMHIRWKRSKEQWDGLPVLPPFEAYAKAGKGQGRYAK
jgi:hypothetical protein